MKDEKTPKKKTYLVKGNCFVVQYHQTTVKATSEEEAVKKALESDWERNVNGDSPFDWQPYAEEIDDDGEDEEEECK